jgi:hypothetical protein
MAALSPRATASKIAKWLVERARVDEAIQVLCAFAASGPNDVEGQQLLAEALRLDPASLVARAAFERMEGIAGDHVLLDQAIATYHKDAIAKFEREMAPASFRRAQVGFNNNVKYKDHVFHVQTEDSGLDKPHIITHLFADGGRVIKSHKRIYATEVHRADVAMYVRALMKGQQMEMLILLREGKFDDIVEGKRMGGMTILEEPPNVDVKRIARKPAGETPEPEPNAAGAPTAPATAATAATAAAANVQAGLAANVPAGGPAANVPASAPAASAAVSSLPVTVVAPAVSSSAVTKKARGVFQVQRSLVGGPASYPILDDEVILGSTGAVQLFGEKFCHPSEAVIRWRDGRMWLEDLPGGNGAFLRVRSRVELTIGDEFIIGDQLFRVEKNPVADDEPDPDPTYFYSSPKWPSTFRVVQVFEGGALGACAVARGGMVQIGSAIGDIVCAGDPLVSEQHCVLEEQAQVVVLTDLDTRTGVFVRLQGEAELVQGDEIILGRTRLLVDLHPPA